MLGEVGHAFFGGFVLVHGKEFFVESDGVFEEPLVEAFVHEAFEFVVGVEADVFFFIHVADFALEIVLAKVVNVFGFEAEVVFDDEDNAREREPRLEVADVLFDDGVVVVGSFGVDGLEARDDHGAAIEVRRDEGKVRVAAAVGIDRDEDFLGWLGGCEAVVAEEAVDEFGGKGSFVFVLHDAHRFLLEQLFLVRHHVANLLVLASRLPWGQVVHVVGALGGFAGRAAGGAAKHKGELLEKVFARRGVFEVEQLAVEIVAVL